MSKKRLIKLHTVLSLVIAVVVTIVIAFVVFQRSGLLSNRLSRYVNDHYLKDSPFRFSCGRISGDFVGRVSVARPVLRYQGEGESFEVFRAGRLSVEYDLVRVLALEMIVSNLSLEDVHLRLREDAQGHWVLPAFEGSEKTERVGPHIEIHSFNVSRFNGVLERADTTVTVKDASIRGSMRLVANQGEIEIDEAQAHLVEHDIPIRSLRLTASVKEDSIAVQRLQIRLGRTLAMISGRYENGRFYKAQAVFNPVDLSEFTRLAGFKPEHGELGGNVTASGAPDSLLIEGNVTGKGFGLALSGLAVKGVLTPREARLDSINGHIYGSRVDGSFTYQLSDGAFTFDGRCSRLDISPGFVSGDGIPHTDLNGAIKLEFDPKRRSYEISGNLGRSSIRGLEAEAMIFRLNHSTRTGLKVRSAVLTHPGFRLTASGGIDANGEADVILGLTGDDVDYLMDYLTLPRVGGTGELSGRVVGPADDLQLNMNGTWNDLSYLGVRIDSSQVRAEATGIGSDAPQAKVDVTGTRIYLGGRSFIDPHIRLAADGRQVQVQDFRFFRGDTLVTGNFDVTESGGEASVEIGQIVVSTPNSVWKNTTGATLVLTESSSSLDSLVMRSGRRLVGLSGFYSKEGGRCHLRTWGRNLDLGLLREGAGLSFRLDGTCSFDATIRGDTDNPDMDLSARVTGGVVDSLTFDRLELQGGFGDGGYFIRDLRIVEGSDSVTASGSWRYMDSPWRVVRRGVDWSAADMADTKLRLRGHRYPLSRLLRAAHRTSPWDGAVEGDLFVENTLADPHITVLAALVSRPSDPYQLPRVELDLAYRDSVLEIRSVGLGDGATDLDVRGFVPVAIDLKEGLRPIEEFPVGIRASFSSDDLSEIAPRFERIAHSGGRASGRLEISGALGQPRYRGSIDVADGELRIRGLEEEYSKISARVVIDGSTIRLESLSGIEGEKGRFTMSGTARFDGFRLGDYDFAVRLDGFTLSSVSGVTVEQDGDLRIRSSVNEAGEVIPSVTGHVDVREAVITKSIGRQEGPTPLVSSPRESATWRCNLDVAATNNVWLRNPDLNMELGGDLIMRYDERGLYFRGDMSVLRGSYTLYNNKFRITDGRIDFSTAETVRPDIYMTAYTLHRFRSGEELRIILVFNFPADKKEPDYVLSSDPPGYSEPDLWRILGGQVVAGTGATGGTFDAADAARNIASNYLERVLNARMLDTTIELESDVAEGSSGGTTGQDMSVAIGRYLSEDIYLRYRQGLSFKSEQEVNVEYRLSKMFLFRSEIIHYSSKGIPGTSRQATDEVNFDIKFRWEY